MISGSMGFGHRLSLVSIITLFIYQVIYIVLEADGYGSLHGALSLTVATVLALMLVQTHVLS